MLVIIRRSKISSFAETVKIRDRGIFYSLVSLLNSSSELLLVTSDSSGTSLYSSSCKYSVEFEGSEPGSSSSESMERVNSVGEEGSFCDNIDEVRGKPGGMALGISEDNKWGE